MINGDWWEKESLIPFNPRSSTCISGPTNSGKPFWVYQFLKNISGIYKDEKIQEVLYCYAIWQPIFFSEIEQELPFVCFHEGLPNAMVLNNFLI